MIGTWARRAAIGALATYTAFAAALYAVADGLIFVPHPAGYADDGRTRKLALPDGTRITAAWLPNPAAHHAILYSHGNAEDLGDAMPTLEALNEQGFAVLGYDYPGYGTSGGTPSSAGATLAAEAAHAHLVGELGWLPARVIAHGRSIGGGPTVALAARRPVGGLILESTFTSIRDVQFGWPVVPFDRFRSLEAMAGLAVPTLVIHGGRDRTIPFAHGEALHAAARGAKRHLWVPAAGHNDLHVVAGVAWARAIRSFAKELVN